MWHLLWYGLWLAGSSFPWNGCCQRDIRMGKLWALSLMPRIEGPSLYNNPYPSLQPLQCHPSTWAVVRRATWLQKRVQSSQQWKTPRKRPSCPQWRDGCFTFLCLWPACSSPWAVAVSLSHLSCCFACWGESDKAEREVTPPSLQIQKRWLNLKVDSYIFKNNSYIIINSKIYNYKHNLFDPMCVFGGMANRTYNNLVALLLNGNCKCDSLS